MRHSSFTNLSYSELKELRFYLRSHISNCISRGIFFPGFSLFCFGLCKD